LAEQPGAARPGREADRIAGGDDVTDGDNGRLIDGLRSLQLAVVMETTVSHLVTSEIKGNMIFMPPSVKSRPAIKPTPCFLSKLLLLLAIKP